MAVIATAEVRVIADTSRFTEDLRRKLRSSLNGLGDDFSRSLTQSLSGLGEEIGRIINREVRQAHPQVERSLDNLGNAVGNKFNTSFQNAIERNANYDQFFSRLFHNTISDAIEEEAREASKAFEREFNLEEAAFRKAVAAADAMDKAFEQQFAKNFDKYERTFETEFELEEAAFRKAVSTADAMDKAFEQQFAVNFERRGEQAAEALQTGMERRLNFDRLAQDWSRSMVDGRRFTQQAVRGIGRDLERQLAGPTMSRYGKQAGRDYSRSFGKSLRAGLKRIRPDFQVEWNASAIALVAGAIGAATAALAGIPAAVGIASAAIATLLVAFRGVGTAISAALGDADEFEDAIRDLAPAARRVMREFRSFREALTSLRIDAQEALFAELDGTITSVADNLGGPVRRGMTRAAGAFGRIASAIGDFFSEAATADTVEATFRALEAVFDDLAGAARPALRALRTLADDILPELTSQTRPITRAAEAFEAWAEAMSESGQTVSRWRGAMGFLRHIGTIASVAGRAIDVLGGAVGAFAETSQPFWRALKDALEALRSPLQNVGESLGRLLAAFAPLLEPLGLLVALVIDIAATLLTVLSPVIEGIASVLNAILTPALEWVQGQFGSWQEAMEGVSNWMETVFLPFLQDEIIPFFQETFGRVISWIKERWDEWYAAMVAVATYIAEEVWPVIRDDLLPALQDLWDEGRKLYKAWMDLQDALFDLATSIAAELVPELDEAEGATGLLNFMVGALIASIRGMTFGVKIITATLRPWVDGLRAAAGAVSKAAANVGTARAAMEGLLGTIDRILQQGGRVIGIFDNMRSAASNLAGAISRIPSLPSGLSSGLSGLLPFGDGGIVWGPQVALIGEAGPEVVIPLTRPERAATLAAESGLLDILAARTSSDAASPAPVSGPNVEMHVHSGVADAEQVARRALRMLERRMEPRGLERVR